MFGNYQLSHAYKAVTINESFLHHAFLCISYFCLIVSLVVDFP